MKIKISIIIPVFNEAAIINKTLDSIPQPSSKIKIEVIVVDGNKSGSTLQQIGHRDIILLKSPKGRGVQMNFGAKASTGDVLLFLHADTFLPVNGLDLIKKTMEAGPYAAGAFNYNTKGFKPFLKHVYYTSYLRSRISRIPYGDQAIFINRNLFFELGQYLPIPLLEDVSLMKKVKKAGHKIRILKEGVQTSSRRFKEEGVFKRYLQNHRIRFLYQLGVPPEKLVKYYPTPKDKGPQ